MPSKIHVKIAPFGQPTKTLELEEGTTVERALQTVSKPFSAISVRVGGKSVSPTTPLKDGQILTTDIPRIIVG